MKSRVSLVAALLAAVPSGAQTVPLPPEAGTPAGPSGTAGTGTPGGYDAVVYAEVEPGAPGVAIVAPLPRGSYAEVTDLASGRTILASVAATAPGVRPIAGAMASARVVLPLPERPTSATRVPGSTDSDSSVRSGGLSGASSRRT